MAIDHFFVILVLQKKTNKEITVKSTSSDDKRHDFSFSKLIPKHLINYLCEDCQRFRVFDPSSTLYCFLYQVLNSCSAKSTLLNFNLQRSKNNMKLISMNTAGYTLAKKRLSEEKLKMVACKLGEGIDKKYEKWRFKNRDVLLGDGTVINLEDTDKRKKFFPINLRKDIQQGLPKMRLLCFFSASSGSFLDGEIGGYCGKGQGETTLLRGMLNRIKRGSILVLDRFYTGYDLRFEFLKNDFDYVIRTRDKMAIKLLKNKNDIEAVEYSKKSGVVLSKMKVRYLKSTIKRKGFRAASIYIVTSLLIGDGHKKLKRNT